MWHKRKPKGLYRVLLRCCYLKCGPILLYLKSRSPLSDFSKVERSFGENLPKIFITSLCSIVEIADLTADDFNKPALCQSSIENSPTPIWLPVRPVMAIMIISCEILL